MGLSTRPAPQSLVSLGSSVVTPPFVVAVILLAVAAGLAGPVAKWLHFKQGKQPLPLRAPLNALEEKAIAPYQALRRHVLEPAVVEALGTDSYLRWALEDTSVSVNDPLRYANLMITYDTGGQNLVPHTPDVCWLGGGYERAQPHQNIEIEVESSGSKSMTVPIRVCTFTKTALRNRSQESVIYTFHCNGRFRSTRTGVRLLINEPGNTYAYFSKVEVNFPQATRAQSIEGAKKLFGRVLPLLIQDHWPDFKAEERKAREPKAARS